MGVLRRGLTPQLEERFKKQLLAQKSGTVVLWEVLDRLGHDSRNTDIAERLKLEVARLDSHLSMVFHRYLDEPGRLDILIGEVPVVPWDPFMRSEKATQILGEEQLELGGHHVTVHPFVLPHISKLSAKRTGGERARENGRTSRVSTSIATAACLSPEAGSALVSSKKNTTSWPVFSSISRTNWISPGTSTCASRERLRLTRYARI